MRILERTLRVGFMLIALCGAAAAQSTPVGFLSWDLVFPGNAGAFDFTNLTGPNGVALDDPSLFPISSTVKLTNLTLVVKFANGSSATYLPSAVPPYFSPDPDGESLDGTAIPIAGTNPLPTSATLTGTFNPTTVTLAGGGTTTISPTFTVTISPDTGNSTLADGDYGVVFASIAQAPQTISITTAAPASAVYGSSFSVAATASSGLTVAIAATGSCSGTGGGSASITMTSASGSCSVTFNQAGNASYLPAAQLTESVTSSKAVLTATADSLSKVAGTANPALTYTITGFVNKDTPAVVSGTATLTTTATSTSPIGTYPITFSTEALTATNYTFTYVAGTLTVTASTDKTPPTVAVSSIVVGPPKQVLLSSQDTGSGLASVVVAKCTNCTASSTAFTKGTTSPVITTATKINQALSSAIEIIATDVAGNVTTFDPLDITVLGKGKPSESTVMISKDENVVIISNGNPGMSVLRFVVDGRSAPEVVLKDGETKTISLAAFMRRGGINKVHIISEGKIGGSSWIVFTQK